MEKGKGKARKAQDLSPTVEDYLLAIYSLSYKGREVVGARLAQRFKVSRPTVLGMIRRMVRDGLVQVDARKRIALTQEGKARAEGVMRRHFLAERLFTDLLGIPWYKVHKEAHRMEHVLSHEVEERLMDVLGHPKTCPHGNPIPGEAALVPQGIPLTQIPPGGQGEVVQISEELEDNTEALAFLESHGIHPQAKVKVLEISPLNDTITLETERGMVALRLSLAEELMVRCQ